ncbi:FAD synthase-like [Argiope bruennichi]|uniref:FAD synthase n=1 Tax=Argiope bruennichi TaxID=94029 RepID=A0A8T0F537_ARGBR|nr:FAD synthase-like [Argiope bruennichi]KAF8786326.1 FAD synthase like protein [Argiope bruennichi]
MLLRNFSRILFYRSYLPRSFSNPFSSLPSEVTAGILIIGDEILNGHTKDTNSYFLINNLNSSGLKIKKISILRDDINAIAEEVSELSKKCTVVLTSGGIGPTHDDMTYEAVAKAFGDTLDINTELFSVLKEYFGPNADENPAVIKLSTIPKSAILNYGIDKYGKKGRYPLVSVKNIYMMPGVPMLLERSFRIFKSSFMLHNKPLQVKNIFLAIDEFSVTPILNEAVKLFENHIKFGSYPAFSENYYKVKLTLESDDEEWINKACCYFKEKLPPGSIVSLKENLLESAPEKLFAFANNNSFLQSAILVTEEILSQYSPSEICICFNGGKDCTALLHLLYCCVQKRNPDNWNNIKILYVKSGETFKEVDTFIESTVKNYKLNLITMNGKLKDSFKTFLQNYPKVKVVFLGSRRGDPGTENLKHFCQTDDDWPSVLRVLPILNWSYSEVWHFIRSLQLPYCVLYDRGYTSLGLKSGTVQNPSLLVADIRGFRIYNPAYMLKDSKDERNSRL